MALCSTPLRLLLLVLLLTATACAPHREDGQAERLARNSDALRIRPYAENPAYWQYNGAPVLLLGGSDEDNLFQIPELDAQLSRLRAAGGNYVRCTLSSRDEGNLWPFHQDKATGRYDLTQPNEAYWRRFDRLLHLTAQHNIIVQVELWATFDYYREHWRVNPFNPRNNINYTPAGSRLPLEVPSHPTQAENPFFFTVPGADHNETVLAFQRAFVDQVLQYTLPYGHVLYCIDNETSVTPHWGAYWADYIRRRATERGLNVEVTEMWDPWDLTHEMHRHTFDHPERYTFVDISQNNHQQGQTHWDNAQRLRTHLHTTGPVRPINNVKVYGADGGRFGDDQDGVERFWRNAFGGLASTRFHRPPSGLGLNSLAQANLRSLRMLTDSLGVFTSHPHNDLLADREANEAYCMARPGDAYAVFFPASGAVTLDVSAISSDALLQLTWLDVLNAEWLPADTLSLQATLPLSPPAAGFWAVLIRGVSAPTQVPPSP